jgi:hypothetical protein
MLVLSPNVASRYYKWCTDGNVSPGNYGHPLVRRASAFHMFRVARISHAWEISALLPSGGIVSGL